MKDYIFTIFLILCIISVIGGLACYLFYFEKTSITKNNGNKAGHKPILPAKKSNNNTILTSNGIEVFI